MNCAAADTCPEKFVLAQVEELRAGESLVVVAVAAVVLGVSAIDRYARFRENNATSVAGRQWWPLVALN